MKKPLVIAALVASSLSLVACTSENECPLQEVVVNRETDAPVTILVCVVEPEVEVTTPRPSPTRPPTNTPPTTLPPPTTTKTTMPSEPFTTQ